MKRYWNKFLNWLIPNRREKIIIKMVKQNQELGLYDEPLTLLQELIKVFKSHRDISFEKMKEYPKFLYYDGRADAFKLAIHILELKEEELNTKK